MACEEHENAQRMYCQKCDTFVCDECHKNERMDHYHYLSFKKPNSVDVPVEKEEAVISSAEKIKSIEERAEEIIRRQMEERPKQEKPEKIRQQEQEKLRKEEQEMLRQKALAAVNRNKEHGEDAGKMEQENPNAQEEARKQLQTQEELKQKALEVINRNKELADSE